MTNEQLAEIRARLAAATPGPWTRSYEIVLLDDLGLRDWYAKLVGPSLHRHNHMMKTVDVDFIAHAPTDMAALLAEVERLQEALSHALACDHFRWAKSVLND